MKILASFLFAVTLAACTTVPEPEPFVPPVFPPPPADPRFVFEHTIVSSSQSVAETREMRMRRVLTGESQTGLALGKPFDVQACKGIVYVSDTVRRSVYKFDFTAGVFSEIGVDENGRLSKPMGLAVDSQCNLYVADITEARVMVYAPDGRFIRAFGGKEWFERVTHLAVDLRSGHLYTVDTGGVESQQHIVRVFDLDSGAHLRDIGRRGANPGEFNFPKDIDVGPSGNLYVLDSANFRVQVFDSEGKYLRAFGAIGRRPGQFSRPKGIATDPDGNVYVSDTSHGNFQIFNPDGQLLLSVGDRSQQFAPAGYMLPSGIDVDEDGRVYMVDQFFRKVDVFRPYPLDTREGYLGAWARRNESG